MIMTLINTPPLDENEKNTKLKRVKIRKHGKVSKKQDELEVALDTAESEIKKYIAGVSYELVNEFIEIGHRIRTEYEDLAFSEGFEDVASFIKHVVDFYMSWKDALPKLLEELEQLKRENTLLKVIASKEFKKILRTQLYKELMIYSLAFNVNKELVDYWKQELNKLFNDEQEQTALLSIGDIEHITRKLTEGNRNNNEESKKAGGKSNSKPNDE